MFNQSDMLTVQTPQLNFNSDGIPCSKLFDDPYFSLVNPVEESKTVFLKSTDIPIRWKNSHFTIAELGFGFGINFITTANAWIQQHDSTYQLHYLSFEKYPVQPKDLTKCFQELRLTSTLTDKLITQYPLPIQGFHRILFREHNISLTLIFGDAIDSLKGCDFKADAWYLDGFSPNKNKALWTDNIAKEIFKLTKLDGTFSTYSAASKVRESFTNAGFSITKKPGFGKKREMLIGQRETYSKVTNFPLKQKSWLLNPTYNSPQKNALVIGAGMAGCAISAALAQRGWQITIIEQNDTLASEASGNPNAILMPRLSVDHDTQSQLTLLGYLHTIRYLNELQNESNAFSWHQCSAIQIPRDDFQWQRMNTIASQESLPTSLLQSISNLKASELSQCAVSHDGWHIPLAGWLRPSDFCKAIIEKHADNINIIYNTKVLSLNNDCDVWTAYDSNENEIYSTDTAIIANAYSAKQFQQTHWCELHAKRGQITLIPESECNVQPSTILCADAYVTPATSGKIILGASFISDETNIDIRQAEHADTIQKVKKIIPELKIKNTDKLKGRAAIRAVSSDRLPIVGSVAKEIEFEGNFKQAALGSAREKYPAPQSHQGLYLATGFGSRGLAWIPICTETLACVLNNEPSPLKKSLQQAIHPNRFLMKQLIKRVQSSQ